MAFCSPSMTTKDGRNLWTKAYAIETEKSSSMELLCLAREARIQEYVIEFTDGSTENYFANAIAECM